MDKGGRPKNVVWNDFFCVKEGNKTYGKCKKCGHTMANRVDRMKVHLARCKNVEHVQKEKKDYVNEKQLMHMETDIKSQEDNISVQEKREKHSLVEEKESTSNAAGVKRVCLQNDINDYIVKTTPLTKKQLDLQLAKFFYSCNIPFNVIEQDEFVKLIKLLRPGYKLPSRKAISGNLLDEVTEALETEMKSEVQGKDCTLVEDGWSNVQNEAVIASCLHVEGKVFFLEATDCAGQPKTAEFCKEKVKRSIALAKDKFSCNVVSVVTDNERKMEKMRQLLKEEKDDLLVYGCCAHWMNLLGNEITPPEILKHVVEVQKYFRNHHLPSAWLKECESKDTVKPQLPNATRWNSQLTCIDTYIRNRSSYVKICQDHEIESRIVQLVNNYNLYQQVKELQMQLKPLADSLNMVQGDNATLADACRAWLSLAEEENLAPHHDVIVKRMTLYLQPFHYLAYMTHPLFKGELLNDEQREAARTWLHEIQPNFLTFLIAFEAESMPYPGSFFLVRDVSARVWWKGLKNSNIPTEFLQLMVLLHSTPCSSASIERIFSNFGLIHSKLRNRLGVQKASKLVFCYRMLRGKKELDWDWK